MADMISIHALCEEGDYHEWYGRIKEAISIHALCEEGDQGAFVADGGVGQFLSTPSARRATRCFQRVDGLTQFLSTPSARRATRLTTCRSLLSP